MTPQVIVPEPPPLPLPAPVLLLWGLLLFTLALHVIAMNLLLGGSLLALYTRLRHGAVVHARPWTSKFFEAAPVLAAATISLGVAPLLFLQVLYGRLFFVSSILMAWLWLAVVPALIVTYYTAYAASYRSRAARTVPLWMVVTIPALLLLVGFLYTTNMSLMLAADRFAALYQASGRGWHLNLGESSLWPRYLHMVLGAVAVAGLALVLVAFRSNEAAEARRWAQQFGARTSLAATALNLVTGIWWTTALPAGVTGQLLGGDAAATGIFGVSLAAGLLTLVMLAALTRREATFRLGWATGVVMLLTIVAMLLVRDQLRVLALERFNVTFPSWVVTQWAPLAVFAVSLCAAIGLVGWMVVVFVRGERVAARQSAELRT